MYLVIRILATAQRNYDVDVSPCQLGTPYPLLALVLPMKKIDYKFVAVMMLISYSVPQPAHAYIDPTTGSYALQAAMGTMFAIMFYARSAWNWIRLRQRSLR